MSSEVATIAPHPNAEPGAYVTDGRRLLQVLECAQGQVLLEDCSWPADDPVQVTTRMTLASVTDLKLVRAAATADDMIREIEAP